MIIAGRNGYQWHQAARGARRRRITREKGDCVVCNTRIFLNQGDEVPLNEKQVEHLPKEMIRVESGVTLVDHTTVLGQRQAIAGIEHALLGMKPGGYRKVRTSPHLAYRDKGVPNLIPSEAVLVVELWLRTIIEVDAAR